MAEVSVTGVREAQTALNAFVKDVQNSESLNKELGSIISKQASALAPVRSRQLAESIRYQAYGTKIELYAGNERVEYAPIIEYGWQGGNRQPQRFMNRAIDSNMGTLVKKYEDEIKAGIKKYNLD
jgi:hypothetical protein